MRHAEDLACETDGDLAEDDERLIRLIACLLACGLVVGRIEIERRIGAVVETVAVDIGADDGDGMSVH